MMSIGQCCNQCHRQNPKISHFQVPGAVTPPATKDEVARPPDHGQSQKRQEKD